MEEWKTLSELIGLKVHRINTTLRVLLQSKLKQAGWNITPEQWATIHLLIDHSGINQTDLSGKMCRDQTSVTRLLDGLQKKGLIERRRDTQDKRVWNVYLTDYSLDRYEVTKPFIDEYNSVLYQSLEEQKGVEFINLLDELTDFISNYTGE